MASEEFWSLTWEEYFAREDRHYEEQRRIDERFGLSPATYINCKLKEGAKPIKPGDFFGYQAAEGPDVEMSVEMTKAFLTAALCSKKPAKT